MGSEDRLARWIVNKLDIRREEVKPRHPVASSHTRLEQGPRHVELTLGELGDNERRFLSCEDIGLRVLWSDPLGYCRTRRLNSGSQVYDVGARFPPSRRCLRRDRRKRYYLPGCRADS